MAAPFRVSSVLAADGRPILVAAEPPYRAGGSGRRFAGFTAPVRLGPNAALLPELDTLRARSRALYRNDATIWGAIECLVNNLVGWGIAPQSRHDSPALRARIDALWRDWARQVKLDALQKLAAREAMLAGEVFLRIRPRLPTDTDALGRRLVVPLELQLIEAEHVPTYEDRTLDNRRRVRAGIEFDALGRRAAYWMYPDHPGDGDSFRSARGLELVAVPAVDVIHLFDPESPEALRGVPRLSRVLLTAHDLDAFLQATLQRQAIASLFAGFIRRPEGPSMPGALGETAAAPEPTLEPGTLSYLGEGEDISFPPTPDVGANLAPFVRTMHQNIANGTGLTTEQVSGDLSQVNYSSIRAGSLEFRRACEVWQYTTFCLEFLEPVWVHFLRRAQLSGALPDLGPNEIAAGRVDWVTQGWDWVDPEKEVSAKVKEVQAGFNTRRGVNIERGLDPLRLERERALEVAEAKALELEYSTDWPQVLAAAPAAEPAAPEGETPPEPEPEAEAVDEEAAPPARARKRAARGGRRA